MNNDILKGNWKQMKGKIKDSWGKLTDDEIDQAEGNMEMLEGKIQEKYGFTKEEAREKINGFIKNLKSDDNTKTQ